MAADVNGTVLVLAAHGSSTDAGVQRFVNRLAKRVGESLRFDEVSAAFHLGEPHFSTVLDRLSARRVIVVPLMTSRGYYSDTVLPTELDRSRRRNDVYLTITEPVGTHRSMASIVSRRAAYCIAEYGFIAEATSILLVGHGTPQHPRSAESTRRLAESILGQRSDWDVTAAFLDDTPDLESAVGSARFKDVLIEPFFIADGPHVAFDLPRRLGIEPAHGASLPMVLRLRRRRIALDSAVGTDPALVDVIADLAIRSLRPPATAKFRG